MLSRVWSKTDRSSIFSRMTCGVGKESPHFWCVFLFLQVEEVRDQAAIVSDKPPIPAQIVQVSHL